MEVVITVPETRSIRQKQPAYRLIIMVLNLAWYLNYTRVWGRSRDYGTKKNEQQDSSYKNTCDQPTSHDLCIRSLFIYSLICYWRVGLSGPKRLFLVHETPFKVLNCNSAMEDAEKQWDHETLLQESQS